MIPALDPDDWAIATEAAELTGATVDQIRSWHAAGLVRRLTHHRSRRRLRYNLPDVRDAVEAEREALEQDRRADDGLWLSPPDAAARVGLDRQRVSTWITQGRIRCNRGTGGEARVCLGDVRRLIQVRGVR